MDTRSGFKPLDDSSDPRDLESGRRSSGDGGSSPLSTPVSHFSARQKPALICFRRWDTFIAWATVPFVVVSGLFGGRGYEFWKSLGLNSIDKVASLGVNTNVLGGFLFVAWWFNSGKKKNEAIDVCSPQLRIPIKTLCWFGAALLTSSLLTAASSCHLSFIDACLASVVQSEKVAARLAYTGVSMTIGYGLTFTVGLLADCCGVGVHQENAVVTSGFPRRNSRSSLAYEPPAQ